MLGMKSDKGLIWLHFSTLYLYTVSNFDLKELPMPNDTVPYVAKSFDIVFDAYLFANRWVHPLSALSNEEDSDEYNSNGVEKEVCTDRHKTLRSHRLKYIEQTLTSNRVVHIWMDWCFNEMLWLVFLGRDFHSFTVNSSIWIFLSFFIRIVKHHITVHIIVTMISTT